MTSRQLSTTTLLLIVLIIGPGVVLGAQGNSRPRFFSSVPLDGKTKNDVQWEWRPQITIPALKITKSKRAEAKLDAQILTSVGGGLSLQKLIVVEENGVKRWVSNFSYSSLTVLISGDTAEGSTLDISYATTVGFFNNALMFGLGYDFGRVEGRRRTFFLMSIGINLNNP